jgi:hypothetical protein
MRRLGIASPQHSNSHDESDLVGDNQLQGGSSPGPSPAMDAGESRLIRPGDGNCRGRRLEDLENGFSAKYWLETQRKDPFAMETLRRVLLEEGFRPSLSRSRDEQVIEQVAHLSERTLARLRTSHADLQGPGSAGTYFYDGPEARACRVRTTIFCPRHARPALVGRKCGPGCNCERLSECLKGWGSILRGMRTGSRGKDGLKIGRAVKIKSIASCEWVWSLAVFTPPDAP